MATFSMKAPEEVAKFYGGNKQKILQALQSGALRKFAPAPFDQTIALAAAGFIDEMRNAAQAEQAPQQTVFQKAFAPPALPQGGAPMGGIGAPPPAPPAMGPDVGAPPAGLGATPEAAQMQSEMPEMPVEEAPMGMAEGGMVPPYASGGGLSSVPLPAGMFDEPDGGSYAGGGIIAFAEAGPVKASNSFGDYFEEYVRTNFPGATITSKKRSKQDNARVGGVSDSYHMTDDALDVTPPKGMSMNEFHKALRSGLGASYDVLNENDHIHMEPGPKAGARTTAPKRGGKGDLTSFETQMPRIMDLAAGYRQSFEENASPETKRREQLISELESGLDPEVRAKEAKRDKYALAAQMFFKAASDAGPGGLIGGLTRAAADSMPAYMEQLSRDKTARRADIEALANLETKSNEEKQRVEALAMELAKAEAGLLSDERKMDLQYRLANLDDSTKRAIAAASNSMQFTIENMRQIGETQREGMRGASSIATAKERAKTSELDGLGLGGTGGQRPISVGGWED